MKTEADIFERIRAGGTIRLDDPEFSKIDEVVSRTLGLIPELNSSTDVNMTRQLLSEIIGSRIDDSTVVFAPFHTNFGRFIQIGKNVFINHACTFLDLGGITIEDHVLLGPKVNLITENHPLTPEDRRNLICQPILIKRNAWIGAAATILPGITIGENAVVAAGSVVTRDVKANTVVAGVPAKVVKTI